MAYQKKAPDKNLGRPVKIGPVKISFTTSKQMGAQLKAACVKSGILRSEFCRRAVNEKLNRQRNA